MITSTLTHLHWYKIVSQNFSHAIDFALTARFGNMSPGRYEVDGDNIYVMINEYTTLSPSECEPESHQQYADIQIMIKGSERFGYAPLINQSPVKPFLPDADVAFYSIPQEQMSYIILNPGEFIIFFPSDIHQPELFVTSPAPVKKAVIKVKL